MLQAVLVSPGRIDIREAPAPEPLGGEVVIRVRAALTCGTDLKAYLRGHQLIPMPGPFGHEFSGTIVKAGRDVKNLRIGDDVMAVHSAPCLSCSYCNRGLHNLCLSIMETKVLGAYSEYLLIPRHIVKQNLLHKPERLSFEEASFLEPLACVIHPYRRIDLGRIENALIIGTGPIGLLHAEILMRQGIRVSVCDTNAGRLDIARMMGVKGMTLPEGLPELVEVEADGIGFDLVVECTGMVNVWESTVDHVRRGGLILLFGGCKSGSTVTYPAHRLHYDEITLMSSFHFTPDDVRYAYGLLSEGDIDLRPLISGSYPLKNVQDAFRDLEAGRGIKYAIIP